MRRREPGRTGLWGRARGRRTLQNLLIKGTTGCLDNDAVLTTHLLGISPIDVRTV